MPKKNHEELSGPDHRKSDLLLGSHQPSVTQILNALNNSSVTLFTQDHELRYTWIENPSNGFITHKLIGKTDSEIFLPHSEHIKRLIQLKQEVLRGGDTVKTELKLDYSGKHMHYDLTISPLRDSNNNIVGITSAAIDISEHKRAQEELYQNQQRLQALFDHTYEAILLADDNAKYVSVNAAASALTGYTKEELLKLSLWDLTGVSDHQTASTLWKDFLSQASQSGEYPLLRKDGSKVIVEYHAVARALPGLHLSVLRDVTQRRETDEALIMQAKVLESMAEGVSLSDENGIIVYTNPAEDKIFGYARGELIGKPVTTQNNYPAEENQRIVQEIIEYLKSHGAWEGEFNNRRKDGTSFITAARMSAIELSGKKYFICVQEDITERKFAYDTLRTSEEFNRSILDSSGDCIKLLDLQGNLLFMNKSGLRLFEIEDFSLIKDRNWIELWHGRDKDQARNALEEAKKGGAGRFEGYCETAKGTPKWWDVRVTPLRSPEGKVVRIVAISRDITARRDAEKSLRESEERFRIMAETVPDILFTSLPDGACEYVNQLFYDYTGLTADSVLGFGWHIVVHPEDLEKNHERWLHSAETGQAFEAEYRLRAADGSYRWFVTRSCPIRDAEEKIVRWFGTSTEIEGIKRVEQALRNSEEVFRAIISQATAGIAQTDRDGRFLLVNEKFCNMLGYSRGELLNKRMYDITHPDDIAASRVLFEKPSAENNFELEKRYLKKNGSSVWANTNVTLVRSVSGEILYTVAVILDITDRKQKERERGVLVAEIERQRQQLDNVMTNVPGVVWEAWGMPDASAQRINFISDYVETLLGYTVSEWLETPNFWLSIVHPEDKERAARVALETFSSGKPGINQFRWIAKDGRIVWVESQSNTILDENGTPVGMRGVTLDITERKRAEQALLESEERLRLAVEAAEIGTWEVDFRTNRVKQSARMNRMLSLSTQPSENTLEHWFASVHPADIKSVMQEWEHASRYLPTYEATYRVLSPDGTVRWIAPKGSILRDKSGTPIRAIGVAMDITGRKESEDRLHHNAFHDALTDLPNRALFIDRLEQTIARADRQDSLYAVLIIDLDNFKVVNDSLGHLIGDKLLIAFAKCIHNCLRPGDTLARFGGDEFTILLAEIENVDDVVHIVQRIHQSLEHPFPIDVHEIYTSVSIGVALSDKGYRRPDSVLRDADTAMYKAKRRGKACHVIFDSVMREEAISRMKLETELRRAIVMKEINVHYQPIVDLLTHKVLGCEALARWSSPNYGPITPNAFIPLAEESGLIISLGELILSIALRELSGWLHGNNEIPREFYVSVNLSAKQFGDNKLIEIIRSLLERHHLTGANLRLEITESTIMKHDSNAAYVLSELRKLGVRICMDDFGTGYSSLSYLHRFPIDVLKVDQSFIKDLCCASSSREIVRTIAGLAETLDLEAVAEGAETVGHLEELKAMGITMAQGFLFHHPIDNNAMAALLADTAYTRPSMTS